MPGIRPFPFPWLSVGLLAVFLPAVRGAEPSPPVDPVTAALKRTVIGPGQVLAEVREYAAARVPQAPAVKTVAEWEAFASKTRDEVLRRVVFRGAAATWRDAKTGVVWLDTIEGGPGYTIRKLRYEVLPGLWAPALLYEPVNLKGKVPVVLNVNGHDPKGKAADYKQIRCINQAKRGMIALSVEWFGMGQLNSPDFAHYQINHLDLCGASGVGAFYLAMSRALDLLLALPAADRSRVGVTGLSGGGWQTIFLSALDTRVTLANPVAGYASFRTRGETHTDLGDSEQTPTDLAAVTDYAVMTALLAPRPALLTYNANDNCCFTAARTLPPLLPAATPVYKLYGKGSNLRTHVNNDPGTHNYLLDNRQAFYRLAGDHFFPNAPGYDPKETPSEAEVKSEAQLNVPLPADNQSLHGLAVAMSKGLPLDATLPTDRDAARAWADARRAKLREVVRVKRHDVQVVSSTEEVVGGIKATFWRLKVGEWTVPGVELVKPGVEPKGVAVVVADGGRAGAEVAALARNRLAAGDRVFALDPYSLGEAKVAEGDYLYALLLASLGDRPLGIQATEIAAVARWLKGGRKAGPVTVEAWGPRACVMALTAAGVESKAIDALSLYGSLGSLKEVIDASAAYVLAPEFFCFGLLEVADVAQLAALVAPRKVNVFGPSPRARAELAGLKDWYATWGVDHDPLR